MSSSPLGGTEGFSEAAQAFESVMDAESPSRSRRDEEKPQQSKQSIEDLFPQRRMDRSESEGGANDDPEVVKKRRSEARGQDEGRPEFGEEEGDEPELPLEDPQDDEDEEGQTRYEDEDEEPDEPEAAQGEVDPNQVFRIVVDGEPTEVTLDEMARGYTRTATFHKRLGELGQGVQALNAQKAQLEAMNADYVERNNALEAVISTFMPQEPNWRELYASDPINAARLRFEWDDLTGRLSSLVQGRQQAAYQQQQVQTERLSHFANANRAQLASTHPEWKSEKVWKRDNDSMRRTARDVGYTDQEMAQLYDARAVEILLKASRYDRMMAAKPRPVRESPTKRNGSTPRSRNVSQNTFDRAEKRLSRSGSINDAAAVFESILDRER